MMKTLIDDLMDLAKIHTLNFKFNEEFFDLTALIQQAYNTVKYQAAQKKILISKDFEFNIIDKTSKYYEAKPSYEQI